MGHRLVFPVILRTLLILIHCIIKICKWYSMWSSRLSTTSSQTFRCSKIRCSRIPESCSIRPSLNSSVSIRDSNRGADRKVEARRDRINLESLLLSYLVRGRLLLDHRPKIVRMPKNTKISLKSLKCKFQDSQWFRTSLLNFLHFRLKSNLWRLPSRETNRSIMTNMGTMVSTVANKPSPDSINSWENTRPSCTKR